MTTAERSSLIAIPAVVAVGAGLAAAGAHHGAALGLPVFALAVAAAFIIQWVVFAPSYVARTERFFDLTGSLTYIAVTVGVLVASPTPDLRSVLLAGMVLVWAARLGTFLFRRINRRGRDDRFDEIIPSFVRFLAVWTIQGLWVSFTAAAAWAALTSSRRVGLDPFLVTGTAVWLVGFAAEVVADAQKGRFRDDPANADRFITTGLWSVSRHPNYLGEILVWVGVALVALPVLQGWQYVTLASPLFVATLLTRVSGIPLLEAKADARWGGQADYEAYKHRTPLLIPSPFRKG